MVKLIEVIGRRADWTHSDFVEYQMTTHLEIVQRVPEFLKPVRGYMQNHLFIDRSELAPITGLPICTNTDSIIEVWHESIEAIARAYQLPRYMEIIRPDELFFGDVAGVWGGAVDEHSVTETEEFEGHVKIFAFLRRKAGSTYAQFLAAWHAVRQERLLSSKAFRHVGRFIENRVSQDPAGQLPGMRNYDLIAEMWLESLAAVANFASDPEMTEVFVESSFIEPGSTLIYVGEEKEQSAEWLRKRDANV
jgi:hypothetical protein